jgi:type I restriction enzyme S subunit
MSEWVEYTLDNLMDVQNGYAFKSSEFIDHDLDTYEVLKMGHIEKGGGLRKDPKRDFVPRSEHLQKWVLNEGDIVMAMTDMKDNVVILGVPAKIDQSHRYVLNQRVARLALKRPDLADNDFIYNYLKWEDTLFELQSRANSGVQVNLSTAAIKETILNIPPLPEQRAIADVLSSLDDKIDLLHHQNKTLEAMAETLFRQWFVEEAGADWEEGTLGDEFDFTMGQSPVGSSFNEDKVGVPMFQGNADFGFRFPVERVYTTEPTRYAEPLDTLISVRAPVGAQNMARVRCCIGRGVAAFRYKRNHSFYTYTYFKLRSLMDEIRKFNDEGTVFGSISKSDFQALATVIPPDNFIHNFEDEVKPINDKVIHNCEQIETLEALRDTLLPKLMSGEVRVSAP